MNQLIWSRLGGSLYSHNLFRETMFTSLTGLTDFGMHWLHSLCSLQQTWKSGHQILIFIIFSIFILSFCPISSLQKSVYQNMEQETIFGSFAGLRFPWCWRNWCSENLLATGNCREKKIVSLAILLQVKAAPSFRIQISSNGGKGETRMKKTTMLKFLWLGYT